MSSSKARNASSVHETVERIKDLLSTTKPKIDDCRPEIRSSLIKDLHQVALLSEGLTEQRSRSAQKTWPFTDMLDREGVLLWNTSSLMSRTAEADVGHVGAALKLAGFRLIESGLESDPSIESLIHMLQLASKTGEALSELGSKDKAAGVLTCAAKFEELLARAEDADDRHRQARARARVLYFSSRMDAAWREGNDGIAEFMLQKITDNDSDLMYLSACDRQYLASKILDIGKSSLRGSIRPGATEAPQIHEAIRWMQRAFALTERSDDSATPGMAELKRSILRSLARAYFISSSDDPENLTRADAALRELVATIDTSTDHTSSEFQQLRWMRLAILKRQNAAETPLFDAFRSIIDNMTFSENNVTDVLQELRTLPDQHTLITAVNLYYLRRALDPSDNSGVAFVDRLLLFLIIHVSKDEDHPRAMKNLETAFNDASKADHELARTPTVACLTLMWKYGDREYHTKRWHHAAEWFLAGTHPIFRSIGKIGTSKCLRKAALCYIQQREYALASSVIRRCPSNEAATNYVTLLTAVYQGLEDEAVKAIGEMVKAPDFDPKMLHTAVQLSHERDMKSLLFMALNELLKSLNIGDRAEALVDAMILIRCIIRLQMKLLAEPSANRSVLVHSLIEHFRTARRLVQTACTKKVSQMVTKDISWVWRTAYNCAVQGCLQWERAEDQIADLFDIAREVLETFIEETSIVADAELYQHFIIASFSAASGRVFAARQAMSERGSVDVERLRLVAEEVKLSKGRITEILSRNIIPDSQDLIRMQSFVHILSVFEVELFAQIQEWDKLLQTISDVVISEPSAVAVFEAIADILWVAKDCPVNVSFVAYEAILHASLDRNSLSIGKFSRWLRAICSILLARNGVSDRDKAIGYVEQAVTVMADRTEGECDPDKVYPLDERQWLLATSYNTGLECLHTSSFDEAKRWLEVSAVICRFVPDGKSSAETISQTYTQLLTRFTRDHKQPSPP